MLIIGLGNPEKEYKKNRHNVGWLFLDWFWQKNNLDFSEWENNSRQKNILSDGQIKNKNVILLKPNNYMNNSGQVIANFLKTEERSSSVEKIIVIYDDIDLSLGQIRISFNRGDGGHNGIKSIIQNLKTKRFIRIRVGIAPVNFLGKIQKPKTKEKILDFLLKDFKKSEFEKLEKIFARTGEALECLVVGGVEEAMNRFN
jgi:peptidyl-tRNA hydrolase, PTH1 family